MKILKYIISGILIFGIIGMIIGASLFSELKKKERSIFSPLSTIIFGFFGGIVGAGIGFSIANDEKNTKRLGLDKILHNKYKEGQKWTYLSEWQNPMNMENFQLKTFFHKDYDSVVTFLNNDMLINHDKKSGADKFINKIHFDTLNSIIKEFKSSK